MKILLHISILALTLCTPLYAQEAAAPEVAAPAAVTGEKRDLILKFIDVFGTRRTMEENLKTMFEDMGTEDPQTKKFKDNVRVDDIIEQLLPLYDKNFTEDDLRAFIAFYSSPDGQKLLKTLPVLMQESVDISSKYFEAKFPADEAPADEAPADTSWPSSDTTANTSY